MLNGVFHIATIWRIELVECCDSIADMEIVNFAADTMKDAGYVVTAVRTIRDRLQNSGRHFPILGVAAGHHDFDQDVRGLCDLGDWRVMESDRCVGIDMCFSHYVCHIETVLAMSKYSPNP